MIPTRINPHYQWRQKWIQMVDGKPTGKLFHTWHETDIAARNFIRDYFAKFSSKPVDYYSPIETPCKHNNTAKEPRDRFICGNVIELAPLT